MTESEQILIDLVDDPSFSRWIKGKANPLEQNKWEEWVSRDPVHQEVKRKAEKLYNLPFEEDAGDIQTELQKLHQRIEIDGTTFNRQRNSLKNRSGYRWAVAAAIALLIAVVAVFTLTNRHQSQKIDQEPLFSTIEVGYGEKGALNISDGSTIRLNANSTLRYNPEQFNRSKVEVWLKGEAYFSITRNPDERRRNFIVHTPDGDIRILGTRFNVNTRSGRTGVVLEEGSIEVLLKDSANEVTGQFRLKPGQLAQFSSSEADFQVQKVDTSVYTAWLKGKLVFKNAPLEDVIENIEQTYGVQIEVGDPGLLKEKISGTLRNPDLTTLLKGLEEVLHLKIHKQGDESYLIETDKPSTVNESSNYDDQ
ncbi:FecR domain-containing protein [Aliifodinibius sp. S!AR15-10]|uniref:FecR family protein n=1 Tax=Aliifodinibius sp. S!AR15-10 TaxID=2950437 RepID=UPI00285DD6A7|nr:FecR domain-containing protein [Aliifodinibius sp. S!AR15-10]MDR8390379.1 FecR domain-containing protein [Aliifodinibius sp. S!AR15-10]